ncbi:MAG: hypothetical protein WCS09_13085 [Pseudomonadota bacterium]
MSTAGSARAEAVHDYLVCGVGTCTILVATGTIIRISEAGAAPGAQQAPGPEPLDLCSLPGIVPAVQPGAGSPTIDVRCGTSARRLPIDWVGRIETLAPADFIELPPLFELARRYFDAACVRPFDGVHALRLASLPAAGQPDQVPAEPL